MTSLTTLLDRTALLQQLFKCVRLKRWAHCRGRLYRAQSPRMSALGQSRQSGGAASEQVAMC